MLNLSVNRPTWVEIDLSRLAANYHSIHEFVGTDVEIMAVVKANAYGHGAVECSKRLVAEGANWLAVATAEEAVELRQAGVTARIAVFGGIFPGQERVFLNFELTAVIIHEQQAESLNFEAANHQSTAKVHLKIDTGMNRVGFRPEQWESVATRLSELGNIEVEGLMTQFSSADSLAENAVTEHQIVQFGHAVRIFHDAGHRPKYIDMANSPAAVIHPLSRSTIVRIGGLLYGLADDIIPSGVDRPDVRPVMSLFTRAAQVRKVPAGETIGYGRTFRTSRESVIASVPIGYDDGYRRAFSNRTFALVNGVKAPVVGRTSMDWTTIDVTDCGDVDVGDIVTLIGEDKSEKVTAKDLAAAGDTISYEITCGVSSRVPRKYIY